MAGAAGGVGSLVRGRCRWVLVAAVGLLLGVLPAESGGAIAPPPGTTKQPTKRVPVPSVAWISWGFYGGSTAVQYTSVLSTQSFTTFRTVFRGGWLRWRRSWTGSVTALYVGWGPVAVETGFQVTLSDGTFCVGGLMTGSMTLW